MGQDPMSESAGTPTWQSDWDSGSGDWRPAFDVGFDDILLLLLLFTTYRAGLVEVGDSILL